MKPKLIKAILIDPFACKVEPVELERDNLDSYYAALSHESMPVRLFEVAARPTFHGRDALFFDEEGKFKAADRWFIMNGLHEPIAGKGLIVGADNHGHSADAQTPLVEIKVRVFFLHRIPGLPGFHETRDPWQPPKTN